MVDISAPQRWVEAQPRRLTDDTGGSSGALGRTAAGFTPRIQYRNTAKTARIHPVIYFLFIAASEIQQLQNSLSHSAASHILTVPGCQLHPVTASEPPGAHPSRDALLRRDLVSVRTSTRSGTVNKPQHPLRPHQPPEPLAESNETTTTSTSADSGMPPLNIIAFQLCFHTFPPTHFTDRAYRSFCPD